MFFISCSVETNRAPFDLPKTEVELVAGCDVEYSLMGFALLSLGEYANMILMRCKTLHLTFVGLWPSTRCIQIARGFKSNDALVTASHGYILKDPHEQMHIA